MNTQSVASEIMKSVFFFHYARWTLNLFYYPAGCFAAATVYIWAIHCGHRVKYKGTGRPHFIYFCQKDRKILFIILFLFFSLTGSHTKIILLAFPEQNVLLKGQEQAVIGRISQSDFFSFFTMVIKWSCLEQSILFFQSKDGEDMNDY